MTAAQIGSLGTGVQRSCPRQRWGSRSRFGPLPRTPGLRNTLQGSAGAAATDGVPGRSLSEAELATYKEGNKVKDARLKETVSEFKELASKEIKSLMEQELPRLVKERAAGLGLSRTEYIPGLRDRLDKSIIALQEGLIERDIEVRLLLLAALSGEHILYIGPPGTAKSELGRRLANLYRGKFFERLLTRFSVPEELFGPLSMRALEDDKYVRQIEGYLPDATVAFIDEIFKANSAILNTLLTILNERLFDNGNERIRVPLACLVGASNELPESEELDALYDRFLLRRQVSQVSTGALGQLLGDAARAQAISAVRGSGTGAPHLEEAANSIALSDAELKAVREGAVSNVRVPVDVINLLAELRTHLQEKCEPPVYVSDRRLVKSVALMQVAAYTSGRDSVSKFDCLLLQHVLWQRPDEADRIAEWLLSNLASDDGIGQADYLLQGMFGRACTSAVPTPSKKGVPSEDVLREVVGLREVLVEKLVEIQSGLTSDNSVANHSLWLGAAEMEALSTRLGPKLEDTQGAVQRLLLETVTLQLCIENKVQPVSMADLLPERWTAFIRKASPSEPR